MGSNTIIAIVVGAILVIVGFSLWPVLNGASNSLYSYFRASCDDGNGNRFLQAYIADKSPTLPGTANTEVYYEVLRQHGGKGVKMAKSGEDNSSDCVATFTSDGSYTPVGATDAIPHLTEGNLVHNEQGDVIGALGDSGAFTADGEAHWVEVAPMLSRFAGINNLLLTILPVVSIAGFLGISGAKLYSYGKGTASIGSSISTSVFTLIGIVVAMVIAGPIMGAAVDANQVVVSGQYQVNTTFGNIIQLLFAMIPVVYIAGLVTLVGLQARSALMGGQGGGGGGMS